MVRSVTLIVLAYGIAAALWVSQCSGPKPVVVGTPDVEAPEQPGYLYRVTAIVRNDGVGHGEAKATFRLLEKSSGQAYQQETSVQLDRGETARVVVEIPAPPGSYEPDVEVEYPPR